MRTALSALALLLLLSAASPADDATITITFPDGSRKVFSSEEKAMDFLAQGLKEVDEGRFTVELIRGDDERTTRLQKKGPNVEVQEGFRSQKMSVDKCVVTMAESVARQQMAACVFTLKDYATALDFYAREHDRQYPTKLEELVPNYLHRVKGCPRTDTPYDYQSDGKSYRLHCCGDHSRAHVAKGLPAVSSQAGLEK